MVLNQISRIFYHWSRSLANERFIALVLSEITCAFDTVPNLKVLSKGYHPLMELMEMNVGIPETPTKIIPVYNRNKTTPSGRLRRLQQLLRFAHR